MEQQPLHDVFERRFFAESVIELIKRIKSPYCIGIDAKWGNGKTTFVSRFMAPTANKNNIPIVVFDSFEHERAGDPLFSITKHILETLNPVSGDSTKKEAVVSALRSLAIGTGKVIVNTALQTLVKQNLSDLFASYSNKENSDIAAENTTKSLESYLAERLQDGFKEKEIKLQFSDAVKSLAQSLSDSGKIIVVIDELDRCRPTFALDVLEAIKHILHVEGLVFVLTYHREQLCNAIGHQFGVGIDANLYLHKFVQLDLALPEGQIKNMVSPFIKLAEQYMGQFNAKINEPTNETFVMTLQELHKFYDLEIRTLERCITMFFATDTAGYISTEVLAVLIVWCAKHPSVMKKFQNSFPLTLEEYDLIKLDTISNSEFFSHQPYPNRPTSGERLRQVFRPSTPDHYEQARVIQKALRKLLSFA